MAAAAEALAREAAGDEEAVRRSWHGGELEVADDGEVHARAGGWRAWRGSGLSYWRLTKTAWRTTDAGAGLAPLPREARKKEGIEGEGRCGKMGALREEESEIERWGSSKDLHG